MRAFEEFLQYKTRVPVRGAILLNEAMDSTVLVKGWKKGANWSFPRGKINKDEDDLDCAIREVYEETGFDIKEAGLVPKDDEVKYIEISMREQQIRLYVFRNIPMDTLFQPKTRKEISKIAWYKLSELPAFRKKVNQQQNDAAAASNANKFYMVAPFLVPLKKWVVQQKKKDGARNASYSQQNAQMLAEEPLTEDDIGMQTDPVQTPSATVTPAIETVEGATLELQRLLKIQPPTQGLQMHSSAGASSDKGEALMAILQKKASEHTSQHQPQPFPSQVPHTPFDLTYSNAPEPHTPHHHHPVHRLPVPNFQPPPNFPIPPQLNQNSHANFNYVRPHVSPQIFGRNPYMNPAIQPRQEPVLLHPQPLPPQVQQSRLTRDILQTPNLPDASGQAGPQPHPARLGPLPMHNPPPSQYQQAPKMPAPLTSHAASLLDAFKQNDRRSGEQSMHGPNPQNLSHPQPHIPHHQQPQQPVPWSNSPSSQQPYNPAAQFLPPQAAPAAQPSPGHGSPASTQSKPAVPTEAHRSALLDMFKKTAPLSPASSVSTTKPSSVRGGRPDSATTKEEVGVSSGKHQHKSSADAIRHALHSYAPDTRPSPNANSESVISNVPFRPTQILARGQSDGATGQAGGLAQQQQQRSSPTTSVRSSGSTRVAREVPRNPMYPPSPKNPMYPPSPKERSRQYQQQQADGNTAGRGGIARAKSPLQYASYPPVAQAALAGVVYGGSQGQAQAQQQPASFFQQQQQQQSNHARRPSGSSATGAGAINVGTPEQKQKLLSLFGKASPAGSPSFLSAAPAAAESKGKEVAGGAGVFETYHHPSQHQQQPYSNPPSRSRVASLVGGAALGGNEGGVGSASGVASGPGSVAGGSSGPASRRGSKTPISPADRNFLLSYLQNAASKGGSGH